MSDVPMRDPWRRPRRACAVCKLQRRGCKRDCTFAPYFPAEEPFKSQAVHRKFGFGNVQNMMKGVLDERQRDDLMNSIIWESLCRAEHPVQGCFAAILHYQSQIALAEQELQHLQAILSLLR